MVAARCQILAVRGKTDAMDDTKYPSSARKIPAIEVAERVTPPTFREPECEPS